MSIAISISETAQDRVNGSLYRHANLVQGYSKIKLFPSEAAALIRYREAFLNQRVLDMGCGAGRLAAYLRPLTDQYVGIDISPRMVEHCRRVYPELAFHQADMRSLDPLEDASFDAILAISNLFDAVPHDDRLRVFSEVHRVLDIPGLLVFSSHNRNYVHAGAGPTLEFSRNPLTQLRYVVDYLQAQRNHRRYQSLQSFQPEYSLINDSGNEFRNLHYYIDRNVQARQLEDSGFQLLDCLDPQGMRLGPSDDDRECPSILYIARRAS